MPIARTLWFRVLALAALVLGGYALAGFWLAPRLIRSQATDYVRNELGKQLSLGEIRSNPFTFELEVRDIAIGDGGPPVVALRRLYADFQLASLWRQAWTFREVTLDGPFARTIIRPDGSLNLAELVPKSKDKGPLPSIRIELLRVRRGQVNFADQSRRLKPEKTFSPIEFELHDFHTTAEGGGFKLSAASTQGERFDWSGRLSLQPIASDGKFKVSALRARSAYEFFSEDLPFEINGGQVDLAGNYRFSAGAQAGTRLDVTLPEVRITELGLRMPGGDRDWVSLAIADTKDMRLSLDRHSLGIASLSLTGLRANAWSEADGSINLRRLFIAPEAGPTAQAKAGEREWSLALGRIDLQQGHLNFEDRSVSPAASFELSPLTLSVGALSQDLGKPLALNLQATINGKSPLSLHGDIVPATGAANLSVDLGRLPLRALLSYLPRYPALDLRSGEVEAIGDLKIAAIGASKRGLQFSGSAGVHDFRLVQRSDEHDLLRWDTMNLEGVDFQAAPTALTMQRVRLHGLFAQVEIAPDQSLNLVTVLASPAVKTAGSPSSESATPPIRIGEILLDAGTMSFADYSIQPNFHARIDALRGSFRKVSTATDGVTAIDLDGQVVNRFSPVSIKGETQPFAFDKHTDITMKFSNIELPIFNPYSGRFAGYAIAKGKLTTELHYRIDDRKLTAGHHIVLDQLEWGAATDSKDKVSLPIRLATSLLKDRHGVINLDVPVNGTLDDPTFRIGPIVWQIVKNIVVKIVTSPFSFLGSLFHGAEDAQFVDFAPGSALLADKAHASLTALAKSLADRPQLKLDIPVGTAGDLDAQALTTSALESAIAAFKQGQPAYASLAPEDKFDRLRELYKLKFGKKPELPEAAETDDEATHKEKKLARTEAAIVWMETQLRPRFQPDAAVLAELGQTRAKAVQEALLEGGELDPSRVFLAGDQSSLASDGVARMQLGLK